MFIDDKKTGLFFELCGKGNDRQVTIDYFRLFFLAGNQKDEGVEQ